MLFANKIKRMNTGLSTPLVSIVLATYNGEKYLREQLDSLLNQTYQNIEIIAVDDKSSDSTFSILQEYANTYKNIKVYANENNLGYIKNFERGCSLSTGDLISLCDQDDYWDATKIEKLVNAIGNNIMIYCDSFLCYKDLTKTGKKISDVAVCRDFNTCLQQAVFCRIYGHATLFKRELLKKVIPFIEIIPHDWWLSYIATLNGSIKFFPEALVYYRQHETNQIGAVNMKRDNKAAESRDIKKQLEITKIRNRVKAFYETCDNDKVYEKKILGNLLQSYQSFSLGNNCKRMLLFFKYQHLFLSSKKRSLVRQYLFCLKMFVMIK